MPKNFCSINIIKQIFFSAKPEIVKSNVEPLINLVLDNNAKDDLLLKFTCQMFRVLYGMKNDDGIPIK